MPLSSYKSRGNEAPRSGATANATDADYDASPIEHITRNPGEIEKDITIRRLARNGFGC